MKWLLSALTLLSLCLPYSLSAQKKQLTIINGTVTDAATKDVFPFATIAIQGKNIGTTSDLDGKFHLETLFSTDSIEVSFLGYQTAVLPIQIGKRQKIKVALQSASVSLNEVTVVARKKRYKNKDNPAVALIRKVSANKDLNKVEKQAYTQYDQYEKLELDLNNITDKFKKKRVFKDFQFAFDYIDTSELNGKPYLPIYFQETAATIYHRASPETEKEYQHATKRTESNEYMDTDGVETFLEKLYQNFDIYESEIILLDKRFTGPVSPIGPQVYKYYINDTIEYKGHQCVDLRFQPRNSTNLAFTGYLIVDIDANYAILDAELGITKNTNINFVNAVQIKQTFEEDDQQKWLPVLTSLLIDFKMTKKALGVYGKRTVAKRNFIFNQPAADSIYNSPTAIIKSKDRIKDEAYWSAARQIPLSENEAGVYVMLDSIQRSPVFKKYLAIGDLLMGGHLDIGGISLGPIYSIYSFNSVEGSRFRFGARTNDKFSKNLWLKGLVIYGLKDKQWKYAFEGRYAFSDKVRTFPRQEIGLAYAKVTNYPGLNLQFVDDNNFFLSFKRGDDAKMLLLKRWRIDFLQEFRNNFSFNIDFQYETQMPYGHLKYEYLSEDMKPQNVSEFKTAQFGLTMRYAPQESIYEGENYRKTIKTNHPIYTLNYQYGAKGILGSDYQYHRLRFNVNKRIRLGFLGYGDAIVEAGTTIGKRLPYTLLNLPEANQSFFYNPLSYNMMNFLEFSTDQYASIFYTHFFEGFFFNKIPLINRLKLRSLVSCKLLYGGLSDANNPVLNKGLIQYPTADNGTSLTRSLGKQPYIEASIGIYNIFEVLRFDLVKRVTYLDGPAVPSLFGVKGLGFRTRFKISF